MGRALKKYADYELSKNVNVYHFHFRHLKRIVKSRFYWNNLPSGIPQKFIEETLFTNGMIIFYKEDGFIKAAPCTENGINAYTDGISFEAVPENGGSKMQDADKCVVIYNSSEKIPSTYDTAYFAKRLQALDNTIDTNLEILKTPYIVSCSENQRLSAKEAMKSRLNGEPVVYVNEGFEDLNSVKVWTLDGQKNHVPELEETKRNVMNEFLSFFGINNTNILKKERLTQGENEQNNEEIEIALDDYLSQRLEGVKKLNEFFGLNVELDVKEVDVYEYTTDNHNSRTAGK